MLKLVCLLLVVAAFVSADDPAAAGQDAPAPAGQDAPALKVGPQVPVGQPTDTQPGKGGNLLRGAFNFVTAPFRVVLGGLKGGIGGVIQGAIRGAQG